MKNIFDIYFNICQFHSSSVNFHLKLTEKIVELYRKKMNYYKRTLKEKDELIDKLMQQQSK